MEPWIETDIGNILVYRKAGEDNSNEKVAIFEVYGNSLDSIGVIDYPISLKSKFALLGLLKCQEKKSKEHLKSAGDWYLAGIASQDEMNVLYKLKKLPKNLDTD